MTLPLLQSGPGRAGAAGPPPTTWNPADKTSNVTLSNGNMTATNTNFSNGGARSTVSETAGKHYFEVTWNTISAGPGCGIIKPGSDLVAWSGNATDGLIVFTNTGAWFNGGPAGMNITPITAGQTVCFAVDLVNGRLWARKDAGLWNNSGSADPVANSGGINISSLFPTSPACVAAGFSTNAEACTANFGATAYAQTPPSGFSNWT